MQCLLNGRRVSLAGADPDTTLLDFVRAQGLTGAKEGCAEGECGACAVALVVPDEHGRASYRIVNSCLIGLPLAAGHEIHTVESLAEHGELSDAQRAMAAAGGSQCGYCTPGFVMSLFAEQYRRDRSGPCDVHALGGNLCRCTGYRPIRDAAAALGPPPPGRLSERLREPAPALPPVSAERFSRPATVDQCLDALARDPEATVIAGSTDLGVEANLRGRHPAHLVSVEAVDELREFSETDSAIRIGAALPLTDIERRWTDPPAWFREWTDLFASLLIRNRATLGGNLATASPIGDAAPLLLALDARVHIAGPEGRRSLPLTRFFVSYRKTALERSEILTSIEIPKPFPSLVRFYKIAKRRMDDISTVAAAFAIDRDRSGRVTTARLGLGGVAATPVRVIDAEESLAGHLWSAAAIARAQDAIRRTLSPLSDHRGSREYRLEVSSSLLEKLWWESQP